MSQNNAGMVVTPDMAAHFNLGFLDCHQFLAIKGYGKKRDPSLISPKPALAASELGEALLHQSYEGWWRRRELKPEGKQIVNFAMVRGEGGNPREDWSIWT